MAINRLSDGAGKARGGSRSRKGGGSFSSRDRKGGGSFANTGRERAGGGSFAPKQKPVTRSAPTPATPPRRAKAPTGGTSSARLGGTGYAGGPALSTMAAVGDPAPTTPAPVSEQDYLAGDAAYQAQVAALKSALQNQLADFGAQTTRYDTDYNTGLSNLGWQGGDWNRSDLNTASGKGIDSMQNDFASRGLLQSSGFATGIDDFFRTLNDQRTSMEKGRTSFLDDVGRQRAQYESENKLSMTQAQAEALARRAAGLTSL